VAGAHDLDLKVPEARIGSFFPSLPERRRRIDRALFAVVMETCVHRGWIRSVGDLVKALGADGGIFKSEVSRVCGELDGELTAFKERPLDHTVFPYVFLDATCARFGPVCWRTSSWSSPTCSDGSFPQVKKMLLDAATDFTAFADLPSAHWKKLWSTNPLERLNREIKRRADVVQVFPQPRRPGPTCCHGPGRTPRRVAGLRPPIPLRSLHGRVLHHPANPVRTANECAACHVRVVRRRGRLG